MMIQSILEVREMLFTVRERVRFHGYGVIGRTWA